MKDNEGYLSMDRLSREDAKKVRRTFQIIAVLALFVVIVGTVSMHHIEKWAWIDSLYFSVISLTTVGYGDITPETDIGKLFTIGYLISGIGIMAALVNNVLKSLEARRVMRKKSDSD